MQNGTHCGGRPSCAVHRRSVCGLILVTFAVAALAFRALEASANSFALVRIFFSVAALGFVFFVPYTTLAKRALAVLALDVIVGCATFALVDIPFVFDHQTQIDAAASAISDRVGHLAVHR